MSVNNNPFAKFYNILKNKNGFLPPNNLAPKSMAIFVFAFLISILGGLIGFVGQSLLNVNAVIYIGWGIVLICILIMILALLHYFFWFLSRRFKR